jgi:5-methylcytosine-specific restriction enzyme subunit McrC
MRSRYVTAFEHQPIPVSEKTSGAGVTPAEGERLALLGDLRPGFCERGYQTIRLAQYCGVVSLGTRVLEILPKVGDSSDPAKCRGLLLRLLREVGQFPLFRHMAAGQRLWSAPLLEIFIAAFFDEVTLLVRGGLLRKYQAREEDTRVVRGRIVASRQFAVHANRPDRLTCRFDDLTADNVWNRVIKAGLVTVRPWIRTMDLNRRWVELMVVLDEVEDVQFHTDAISGLVFDRQAVRYRAAVEWVRWILSLLSPAISAGENAAPGLLFDMNLLFQSVITSVLKKAAGRNRVEVHSQKTATYLARVTGIDNSRAFGLRPDIVVRRSGEVLAIGDTKWRRLEVTRTGYMTPTPGEMYQMLSYAIAFRCEELALIYPWHAGLVGSKETAFELPKVGDLRPVVTVLCVDLDREPFLIRRGREGSYFGALLTEKSSGTSESVLQRDRKRSPELTPSGEHAKS